MVGQRNRTSDTPVTQTFISLRDLVRHQFLWNYATFHCPTVPPKNIWTLATSTPFAHASPGSFPCCFKPQKSSDSLQQSIATVKGGTWASLPCCNHGMVSNCISTRTCRCQTECQVKRPLQFTASSYGLTDVNYLPGASFSAFSAPSIFGLLVPRRTDPIQHPSVPVSAKKMKVTKYHQNDQVLHVHCPFIMIYHAIHTSPRCFSIS